jgi:hypothetical protein
VTWLTDGYTAWLCAGTTDLAPPSAGIQTKPGTRFYPPRGFWATQDGAYSIMGLHGDQPITQPCSIRLYWNGAAPPVIGFDVNFSWQGQVWNIPIRHTTVTGDTQLNALKNMLDQFQNHPTIKALFCSYPDGEDILSYCYVRREPAQGEPHRINIFGHWKLIDDTGINIVAAAGMLVEGVDAGTNRLSSKLEVAPFFHISRSTFDGGRLPRAGDIIGGITFGHDLTSNPAIGTTWRPSDGRNADPTYGWIMVENIDAMLGKSRVIFTFDEFVFQDKSGNRAAYKPTGGANGTLTPC